MTRLLLIAIAACCLSWGGCNGTNDPSTDADDVPLYAGCEVHLVVPAGLEIATAWAPAFEDWAAENDASFSVTEYDFGSASEDWVTEMVDASASLVVLPTPLVSHLVGANVIAEIPAATIENGEIAWTAIPPSVRQSLGMLGGKPAMLPISCPTPICCYRADLLAAAEKDMPTTWDEYDALAASLSEWAPGLRLVEPLDLQSAATVLLSRAISGAKHPAQYSVELDAIQGTPLIDTSPFTTALTALHSLSSHRPPQADKMSPADCLAELQSGRAAMGIIWETSSIDQKAMIDHHVTPNDERGVEVVLRFSPLPGRISVYDRDRDEWVKPPLASLNRPALCGIGGLSVCVLTRADELERSAAWSLWGWLEAYQTDGTIPSLPGIPVRDNDGLSPPEMLLTPGEEQSFADAVRDSLNSPALVVELPFLDDGTMRNELTAAIHRVLDDDASPKEALADVSQSWQTSIDTLGRIRVLNSYRRRLGLTPRLEP